MRDPMEDIIAEALASGDKVTGLRRVTCNAAARSQITCRCGEVLDQHTVTVIERIEDDKTLIAYCPSCIKKDLYLWPTDQYRIVTWENQ